MTVGSLDAYLGLYAARWDRFRSCVETAGAVGLERTTASGWTAKELVAHIAFWEEAAPFVIEHMLRGKPQPERWPFPSGYDPLAVEEPWPDDVVHNAREAAWAREQPVSVILERLDHAHARLLVTLETLTGAELETHATYLASLHGHLEEHQPELDAVLGSVDGAAG